MSRKVAAMDAGVTEVGTVDYAVVFDSRTGRVLWDGPVGSADMLELTDSLPDGLWGKGQRLFFECRACGLATEWEGEHGDFDAHNPANVCGRSPRCCP